MRLGIVVEKNWTLSVDQCRLQTLQFWVHLVDLLSILLRCNGFSGIQNAVVDHQTVTMTSFGVSLALGWRLELLLNSTTELIISSGFFKLVFVTCYSLRTGLLLLHRIREDTSKQCVFF